MVAVPEPRVAIQGETGSNSHLAAQRMFAGRLRLVPCALSAEVFERVEEGTVDAAVLPIENSLHGSVAEHYDYLLGHEVEITGELSLRIEHHVIAAGGVELDQVRRVLSHPVALSQCRRWLRAHPGIEAVPHYDTAGSVRTLMREGWTDTAALAPALAAEVYGAQVLVRGVEDHAENFTRFYTLERPGARDRAAISDKASIAFALDHRPGALLAALGAFERANLTRIESRPVVGSPWEYVFFVDVRFDHTTVLEDALTRLRGEARMVKELGRYRSATLTEECAASGR